VEAVVQDIVVFFEVPQNSVVILLAFGVEDG
jgi:hypothetical protein